LHVYAVGYKKLAGKNADLIEVHNLEKDATNRGQIDETLINATLDSIWKPARVSERTIYLGSRKIATDARTATSLACAGRRENDYYVLAVLLFGCDAQF